MRRYVALVALLLGALVGCSTDLGLEALGERLARSVCLGAPAKLEPAPNRHAPNQIDWLQTRVCASGSTTFCVGKTTSDPNGLALAVEIRAPGAGLPRHLGTGQPIGKAFQVFGLPQDQTAASVTYGLGLEGLNTITIHHAVGKISSVQWTWVVD